MKKIILLIIVIITVIIVINIVNKQQNNDNISNQPAAVSIAYGSIGENVTDLQERLKGLGYYTGSVTGYYGESTKAAISAFQEAQGIIIDGFAGKQTLEKINSIVTERSWVQFESKTVGSNCIVSPYGNQKDIEFGMVIPFNDTTVCLAGFSNSQIESTILNGDIFIKSSILDNNPLPREQDRTRQKLFCKGAGLFGVETTMYVNNPPIYPAGSFQAHNENGDVTANCVLGQPTSY